MQEELAAKQAITEVIYRYCRALDRMDRVLAETVWHPDGTADYGHFQGTGAEFIDMVWAAHERVLGHIHQVTNVLIEVDGDRAGSEAYVVATLWGRATGSGMPPHYTQMVARGRYVDTWSCRNGVWAIDHRDFVEDLTLISGLVGTPKTPFGETRGKRDRTDPSYRALAGPAH